VYFRFEPLHEPFEVVRMVPTAGVPETVGGDVFAGARTPERRDVPPDAVPARRSSSTRLQRNGAMRPLVMGISLKAAAAPLVEVSESPRRSGAGPAAAIPRPSDSGANY
jgi:hypothetical protein